MSKKSHKCQIYNDKINSPIALLFDLISLWPFAMWGIDVIGPINPKFSNGHMFVLMAIDYFYKMGRSQVICSCEAKSGEEIY